MPAGDAARTGDGMNDVREFQERNRAKIAEMGADSAMREVTRDWFVRSSRHEYPYHFTWMGLPIIQFPQDLVAVQEIVWRVRPDLIVETGVARGGSVVYYASLLQLLGGDGKVVGVDVDIRAHNREAIDRSPVRGRITLIEGSSIDPAVVDRVRDAARGARSVLVCLDSNHTHDHVLAELAAYSPLVNRGSYVIVFDTSIDRLPPDVIGDRPWNGDNSPATAVRAFLAGSDRFVVDTEIDHKLLITECPGGYLKCVKD
jgi:cephalosporin hydroxylase